MKKYLLGFLASTAMMVFFSSINHFLNWNISDFFIGWMSCMAYWFVIDFSKKEQKKDEPKIEI